VTRALAAARSHRLVVVGNDGVAVVLVHGEKIVRRHGKLVEILNHRALRVQNNIAVFSPSESFDLSELWRRSLKLLQQLA
jgi:hypothetical protein